MHQLKWGSKGYRPLVGLKGCPLKTSLSSHTPPQAAREEKKGIWGHPKPRQGEPLPPFWGLCALAIPHIIMQNLLAGNISNFSAVAYNYG